jgi:hypothetical protein
MTELFCHDSLYGVIKILKFFTLRYNIEKEFGSEATLRNVIAKILGKLEAVFKNIPGKLLPAAKGEKSDNLKQKLNSRQPVHFKWFLT